MAIRHRFISAVLDVQDTSLVRPSNWNDDHIIDGVANATLLYVNGGGSLSGMTGTSWDDATQVLNLSGAKITNVRIVDRLIVSTLPTMPTTVAGSAKVGISGDGSVTDALAIENYGIHASSQNIDFFKTRGLTSGSHVAVENGDNVGVIDWLGSDGTNWRELAYFYVQVDGTPTSTTVPGRFIFATTPTGINQSPVERMRITSTGYVGIGTGALTAAPLHVAYSGVNTIPLASFMSAGFTSDSYDSGSGGLNRNHFINVNNYNNDGYGDGLTILYARGTSAVPLAVQSGDELGSLSFYGHNGSDRAAAGYLSYVVDDTPSGGNVPGRFVVRTRPLGGGNPERLRIDSNGKVIVGGVAASSFTNSLFQVAETTGNSIGSITYGNNANDSTIAHFKTRGATPSTHGAVIEDDWIGEFSWFASDGTTPIYAAVINAVVDGTVSAGLVPTRMEFHTRGAVGPNPERMRINSSGNLLINGTSVITDQAGVSPLTQLSGTTGAASYGAYRFSNNAAAPRFVLGKSRGASIGAHTILSNDTGLGELLFEGSDGTQFIRGAAVAAFVDGTPALNSMPTYMELQTTASGGTSPLGRLRIDSQGRINTGGGAPVNTLYDFIPAVQFNRANNLDVALQSWSSTAGSASLYIARARGGAIGTYGLVNNNDRLASIEFAGADGTNFEEAAYIFVDAEGTPAANTVPARLTFGTTKQGDQFSTERLRITSAGTISTNGAPVNTLYDFIPEVEFNGITAAGVTQALHSWSNTGTASATLTLAHARGGNTVGSYGAVSSGDWLGFISFAGADGTNFEESGWIISEAEGAPSANSVPGRMRFGTTLAGDQFASERMRIDSEGSVTIGGFAAVNAGGLLPRLQTFRTTGATNKWHFSGVEYGANTQGGAVGFYKTRGATPSTHGAVVNGDALFGIYAIGDDGTTGITPFAMECHVDGAVSAGVVPARLTISTGSTDYGYTERLRIANDGHIHFGWDSTANYGVLSIGYDTPTLPWIDAHAYSGSNDYGMWHYYAMTRGTSASQTAVQLGDTPVGWSVSAHDGDQTRPASAGINILIDDNVSNNVVPMAWVFKTGNSTVGGGTERMRIDSSGRITNGGENISNMFSSNPELQINNLTTLGTDVAISFWGTNPDNCGSTLYTASKSATVGTHALVDNNAFLGYISFGGSDGTVFREGASIAVRVDGTPGSNDMPSRMVFSTTPDGSGGSTERMRIDNAGRVSIGGFAPTSAFPVDGLLQLFNTGTSYQQSLQVYGNNANSVGVSFTKTRGSTPTTHTIVNNGDYVGVIDFFGSDGSAFRAMCEIAVIVDGAPGSGSMPTAFSIAVTPSGSASSVERLRINNDGQIILTPNSTTPVTLSANGQYTLTPTSNTNFRISYRGSDGVTRVANITLA